MEEPGRLQSMGRYESDATKRLHFHFSLSRNGEGNGNPLQCSCLENPRDGRAWWAAVYGVASVGHDRSDLAATAYQRLVIFLPAILIPACVSSNPAFLMMYSAYKLNKQDDNIQP